MWFNTEQPIPNDLNNPEVLGGKGAGLVWMKQNGINVPPAIIIPTSVCVEYMQKPKTVMKAIAATLPGIVLFFKNQFGYMPLLSVRSGARVSMPGMMDTILNVGITSENGDFWTEKLGVKCLDDCEDRLNEMYGSVVLGMTKEQMAQQQENFVPPTLEAQLLGAIEAVFKSWNNERAVFYRQMNNIPDDWGTAVVVQAMVFGNMGKSSGTGVLFTRNPDTGANEVTGEFLENAQGEDVVAGIRTPLPLEKMLKWNQKVYHELLETVKKMESLKKDVQDVEFTVQEGKLFILQTRNAKRSARAALKIAVDMVEEGVLTREEALKRVSTKQYDLANQDVIDPAFDKKPAYVGLPACSGVATGVVVHTSDEAVAKKAAGIDCILVTKETTPDDIKGMDAAVGVITMEGGATSHAAVVARGMNKPCVVGLGKTLVALPAGKEISLDGATGRVWKEKVPVVKATQDQTVQQFNELLFGNNVVPFDVSVKKRTAINGNPYLTNVNILLQLIAKAAEENDEVFVDLTGKDHPLVDEFNAMFLPDASDIAEQVAWIISKEHYASKVTVFLRKKTELPGVVKHKVVGDVFEDLLMNDGPMLWGGELNEKVERLLQLKAKAGEEVNSIGVFVEGKQCFETKSRAISRLLS